MLDDELTGNELPAPAPAAHVTPAPASESSADVPAAETPAETPATEVPAEEVPAETPAAEEAAAEPAARRPPRRRTTRSPTSRSAEPTDREGVEPADAGPAATDEARVTGQAAPAATDAPTAPRKTTRRRVRTPTEAGPETAITAAVATGEPNPEAVPAPPPPGRRRRAVSTPGPVTPPSLQAPPPGIDEDSLGRDVGDGDVDGGGDVDDGSGVADVDDEDTPLLSMSSAAIAAEGAEDDAESPVLMQGEPEEEPTRFDREARSEAGPGVEPEFPTAGGAGPPPIVTFQAPELPAGVAAEAPAPRRRRGASKAPGAPGDDAVAADAESTVEQDAAAAEQDTAAAERDATATESADEGEEPGEPRRRRRRGRRGRGRGRNGDGLEEEAEDVPYPTGATSADVEGAVDADNPEPVAATDAGAAEAADEVEGTEAERGGTRRRRRRRRRAGTESDIGEPTPEETVETVVKVREPRSRGRDEESVRGLTGSTRLEAKRQRRREGRDQGRRRPPVITEAEFLARREAVDRVMLVRQNGERTQMAVLEDGVLVEHYVTKATSASYAGNVYLGKVQNVLPSMEAAFVDIGRGRNAVLYAGEVNYDASGLEGKPRTIEQALKSGQTIMVQVTKDPIGHKGARLTSSISLPGRYLVYVPDGSVTGISRKLPDTERARLKGILKKIVPENAGVIIRTAAEGASEEELTRDVRRLEAQWQDIKKKADKAGSSGAPCVLYTEPDLVVRVVRDVFNEDFSRLVVSGDSEWDTIEAYVDHVAPDLAPRLSRHTSATDIFTEYRVDEQLAKALDRKVWLPSGGSLVIDRTEAMIVIDVNTGKFTGKGGTLEETVTKNNLEAAEEIVRQLRLRDLGGIIVIDFIDMVLESNRELVLRRLTECLGRDRTKHQVAEVSSLGLVQMTRKRVGQGLLDAFSETCPQCNGRGLIVHMDPVDSADRPARANGRGGREGHRTIPEPPAAPPTAAAPPAAEAASPPPTAEAAGAPPAAEDARPLPVATEAGEAGEPEQASEPAGAEEPAEVAGAQRRPARRRRRAEGGEPVAAASP